MHNPNRCIVTWCIFNLLHTWCRCAFLCNSVILMHCNALCSYHLCALLMNCVSWCRFMHFVQLCHNDSLQCHHVLITADVGASLMNCVYCCRAFLSNSVIVKDMETQFQRTRFLSLRICVHLLLMWCTLVMIKKP